MIRTFNSFRTLGGCLSGTLLALGLAACSQPEPPPQPPVVVAKPKPPPRPAPPKPAPSAQAAAAETAFTPDEGPASTKPSSATVKAPESQQATAPTPQRAPSLAGLTEADITRRFGRPTTVRKTPSANIWTYQDQACTLELFLFTDMRSGEQKVLTYQLSGGGRETLGERGCLERLGNNAKAG